MRIAIVTALLAVAACQKAETPVAREAAPALEAAPAVKAAPKPDLDPNGVTAQQAALDHACDRRNVLPRARPAPEADAVAATGRAQVREKRLHVGRHDWDAAAANDEGYGYSYAGRYAGTEIDILKHDDADSIGWVVVDQDAGPLAVGHLLIPSPDKTVWATADDWSKPAGKIKLYALSDKAWKNVFEFPVEFACDLHWTGDNALTYRTSADFKSAPGAEQTLDLVKLRKR